MLTIQDIISPKQFLGYYFKIKNIQTDKTTGKTKQTFLKEKFNSKDEAWEFLNNIKTQTDSFNFHKIVKTKEKILV